MKSLIMLLTGKIAQVILSRMKTQYNTAAFDVDIISDSSHEKPYDEFTARAQQVKSDALATDEAASLLMGDGEAVTITSSCLSVDVTKKKPPVSVQHLPLLNSSSHLSGKVRIGRKEDYEQKQSFGCK